METETGRVRSRSQRPVSWHTGAFRSRTPAACSSMEGPCDRPEGAHRECVFPRSTNSDSAVACIACCFKQNLQIRGPRTPEIRDPPQSRNSVCVCVASDRRSDSQQAAASVCVARGGGCFSGIKGGHSYFQPAEPPSPETDKQRRQRRIDPRFSMWLCSGLSAETPQATSRRSVPS